MMGRSLVTSLPCLPSSLCSLDTDTDGFLTFEEACTNGLPACGESCRSLMTGGQQCLSPPAAPAVPVPLLHVL